MRAATNRNRGVGVGVGVGLGAGTGAVTGAGLFHSPKAQPRSEKTVAAVAAMASGKAARTESCRQRGRVWHTSSVVGRSSVV